MTIYRQRTTNFCISNDVAYRNTVLGDFLRIHWRVDVTLVATNSNFNTILTSIVY
uniref:Uncharacterized protein n=1 Tax=Heterorhabditis bacteriophora TaxID=37862 RepID=A0A1I7W9E3_HETBA